ncbi:major facilitator superfamily domain-containing protein 6-like isoform X1 [Lytechinus variegatus]|uniref:major facilitator superfamily domain-containing protein 6-like isoform X1 n=2 Tax=Lytechinus variegatus TaxID=7654 RepID=UPI001BB22316|nr:major facilitator superfamily domain-containing protein 6-like isoform X1 [Lytechinus variegatus]
MAAPMPIYRRGGGEVIPALTSSLKEIDLKETVRWNQKFIPVKAVYFLLWSGMVSLLPFLPVYMSYVGLNPVQVGVARGIEPFIGMFSSPLSGSLADKFSMHRFIMVSSIIGTGLVYGSGVFVSLIDANNAMNWTNISHVPLEGYLGELGKIPEPELDSSLIQIKKSDYYDWCHHFMSSNMKDELLCDIRRLNIGGTRSVKRKLNILKNKEFKSSAACCFCKCRLKDERLIELLNTCNMVERIQEVCSIKNESKNILISNEFLSQSTETTDILEWEDLEKKDKTLTFVLMLMIVLVGQFVSNPAVPLLDAAAMALVKECNERGQNVEYGHQRLWGAIAWGVFAPLAGFAVDTYSAAYPESFNKYLPAFLAFIALVLLSVIPALCITFPPHCPSESLASDVCILLQRPKVLVFLYAMFITGISVGVISTYVFLFLAELSGSHTIMGLTLTLTCVAEVPFMFFSTKLVERLGHHGVFVLALFCYAVRFVGYSFLQNPWLVLPIELLHGVTYGALWPACTSYVNLITPDNMLTTMQSITFGIKCGLGEGLGTLLGGVIYYQYGARNLFRGSAVLCMVTLIFYWPASAYLERQDERRERQEQYEEI